MTWIQTGGLAILLLVILRDPVSGELLVQPLSVRLLAPAALESNIQRRASLLCYPISWFWFCLYSCSYTILYPFLSEISEQVTASSQSSYGHLCG